MKLSANHVLYTSSADISDIAKPLSKLGITYFTFTRSFYDGSRVYLSSQSGIRNVDIYLKKKHYLNGNTECKPEIYSDQVLLWSTAPNQKIFDECSRIFGFDHGIFIFDPQENYCDIFSFATHSGNDRIINTYLSKMDLLKSFREYFRDKASHIIKQAENQKFIFPFNETLDIKRALIDLEDSEILKPKSHPHYYLTNRQLACCSLLLKGKTAKEIGVNLNLSARTVESYFDIVKAKLDCKNKSELILKLSKIIK